METTTLKISTGAKVLVWIAGIFAALHAADFIFYGQKLQNLLAAAGFAAMSYGTAKNGFNKPAPHAIGQRASMIGAVLVLISFVLRWTQ